jgi:hypothetical protein
MCYKKAKTRLAVSDKHGQIACLSDRERIKAKRKENLIVGLITFQPRSTSVNKSSTVSKNVK